MQSMNDPIVDTPMVVTLDQIRPYEHNPRKARNARYDDIKASIRERGLDSPPAITRRPAEVCFIIRNGGNTRLEILNELWSETREERFFRIQCLFRPWSARGEIIALVGHLAENELRGELSFIERALGVEKLRVFYEQESGKRLSQTELAQQLRSDGYPVAQPQISRMHDAVQYLLPVIPNLLYEGLGRPTIEKLLGFRRVANRVWIAHSANKAEADSRFSILFEEALLAFDHETCEDFSPESVQDEIIGKMAQALGGSWNYDTLAAEIFLRGNQRTSPGQEDASSPQEEPMLPLMASPPQPPKREPLFPQRSAAPQKIASQRGGYESDPDELPGDDRLQTLRDRLEGHTHKTIPTPAPFPALEPPLSSPGLCPVEETWEIGHESETPEALRTQIAQQAIEITKALGLQDAIAKHPLGLGFRLRVPRHPGSHQADDTLMLLHALSSPYLSEHDTFDWDISALGKRLGPLLLGLPASASSHVSSESVRLDDPVFDKLIQLILLSRRLLEIENVAPANEA
jgi:ParB family protein of integrating conjugative element (PFGI_1 class)